MTQRSIDMSFFISDAIAAADAALPSQADFFTPMLLAGLVVVFYLTIIRPQNKKAKEQRDLLSRLKKGDEVLTSGGILAKIVSIGEQYIKISLADGVEINLQKSYVAMILPKGTMKSL
jgi:preprotein translocase subunit YajC